MVADSVSNLEADGRASSATVSPWPDKLDMKDDMLEPGKLLMWRAALVAALRSRKLWTAIEEQPPSVEAVSAASPGVDQNDIVMAVQAALKSVDTIFASAAKRTTC